MKNHSLRTLLLLAGLGAPWLGHGAEKDQVTWGDLGDGRYRNPILKSDYSDPDVIRVGDDFYLVASDFHFVGIQVLHSTDLVNWKIVGQVFHRLPMSPRYDEMKGYAAGTWAPSLRYHNGEFYLFVCTPTEGLFMWHTKDPAGKWSDMVTVKAVSGWEDPCPFWDDDGQAYLVHSILGAGPLILHKMSADGAQLLDEGVTIYKGPTAEGPKMFKRHGYYYISHPEGGVGGGWQSVERAKTIYGPYERKIVLSGGPHQGGLVELANGEGWFIGFQLTGWMGRICFLEPVKWGDDDWPVFGDNGKAVDVWKKPGVARQSGASRPHTSDDFDKTILDPVWQWNHNPVNDAWSLTARKGFLRLNALPAETISVARNTLTQKLWDEFGIIDVEAELSGLVEGDRAGLTFVNGLAAGPAATEKKPGFGSVSFGWAGAQKTAAGCRLTWQDGTGPLVPNCGKLWLRGEYRQDSARLFYSLDGKAWTDTGQIIKLFYSAWKGARFGVFCYGPAGGHVDINRVHYEYRSAAK